MRSSDGRTPEFTELTESLEQNILGIRGSMGCSPDLVIRHLVLAEHTGAALLYVDGMVDMQVLHQSVLGALVGKAPAEVFKAQSPDEQLDYLMKHVLAAADVNIASDSGSLLKNLLSGSAVFLLEGSAKFISITAPGWEERAVSEPNSQAVVRGPMEGFTENLRTNTTLIRRRIKDSRLWMENFEIGRTTKTNVTIMYLQHLVNTEVLEEVRRRLNAIDTDSILESGYIEEFIQDKRITPFPTIYNTDRPDTAAADILEGKVAILVDGTPFVLLVPTFFITFLQSAEDYYQRSDIATLLRFIRFLAFTIVILAQAVYIALTTYHQEMIPTTLVISLAAQRERVPFPAFVEAMFMEITYEILREAGVRIPKNIGQAISIVGTLVIGQAAVDAGFISSAMVIIVSITAIASFVIPEMGMSISARIIRFILMALAAFIGLYGILFGLILLVLHLTSLRSFGVPYMSPLGPIVPNDLKDSLFRFPWTSLRTYPKGNQPKTLKRQWGRKGDSES
ncbi:spore germination protein [Paenibacillus terreus]|uniref:Spore germination protein n=1 Tax=Paenibacillus terreus TaxID=1387834 RepID=A0ABV5BAY2_9BACL